MWLLIIYVHHDCCCSCLWSWRGDVCLCVKEGVCACWCCPCMQPVCDGCVVCVCVVESPLYQPCPALALPMTTRGSLYFAECAYFAQMLIIFFSVPRVDVQIRTGHYHVFHPRSVGMLGKTQSAAIHTSTAATITWDRGHVWSLHQEWSLPGALKTSGCFEMFLSGGNCVQRMVQCYVCWVMIVTFETDGPETALLMLVTTSQIWILVW